MVVEETKRPGTPPPQPPPAPAPSESKPQTQAKAAPEANSALDAPAAEPATAVDEKSKSEPKSEPPITATVTNAKPSARARRVQPAEPKQEPSARLLTQGEKYLYGRGVTRNCDQAVVYLKAAANAGNAEARSHLGALYSAGECVPRDRVAAYHWFSLAKKATPENPWLESNLNMLWRDMSSAERRRVGGER
jgi:TPR repeat protein